MIYLLQEANKITSPARARIFFIIFYDVDVQVYSIECQNSLNYCALQVKLGELIPRKTTCFIMRMCLIVGFKHMEIPKLGNLSNFEILELGNLPAGRQVGEPNFKMNQSSSMVVISFILK